MTDPKQWKIVPVMATRTMIMRGGSAFNASTLDTEEERGSYVWERVLQSAPASPFIMVSRDQIDSIREAFKAWLHLYASDMCDPEEVERYKQVMCDNGGILAFIAGNIDRLSDILEQEIA